MRVECRCGEQVTMKAYEKAVKCSWCESLVANPKHVKQVTGGKHGTTAKPK